VAFNKLEFSLYIPIYAYMPPAEAELYAYCMCCFFLGARSCAGQEVGCAQAAVAVAGHGSQRR
jgi:hypothetical protein